MEENGSLCAVYLSYHAQVEVILVMRNYTASYAKPNYYLFRQLLGQEANNTRDLTA